MSPLVGMELTDLQPFNKDLVGIATADGVTHYNEDVLAEDPSVITADPYPPGDDFFYVDDIKQIKPGNRIFYSTTAENYPTFVNRDTALLHKARNERKKYHPESPLYAHFDEEVKRLEKSVMEYYQGRVRIKSIRTVAYVDPHRNLVRVTEGFKYGYKPRILGAVVRIVGFTDDMINEISTDRLEKGLKKHYGASWESDTKHYGIPNARANR